MGGFIFFCVPFHPPYTSSPGLEMNGVSPSPYWKGNTHELVMRLHSTVLIGIWLSVVWQRNVVSDYTNIKLNDSSILGILAISYCTRLISGLHTDLEVHLNYCINICNNINILLTQ